MLCVFPTLSCCAVLCCMLRSASAVAVCCRAEVNVIPARRRASCIAGVNVIPARRSGCRRSGCNSGANCVVCVPVM